MLKNVKKMLKFVTPFETFNKTTTIILNTFTIFICIGLWQLGSGELIPTPLDVLNDLFKFINSDDFWSSFIVTVTFASKAMLYSSIISLLLQYLHTFDLFIPIVNIIAKFRYLTIQGVMFLFTMIFHNASDIKMSLLIFGIVPFFVESLININKSIPKEEHNLCKVIKFNKFRTLYELVILGKLDQLFIVIKSNFAISYMMIIGVEAYCMNEGGLGTILVKSSKYIHLSEVFAILIIILLVGVFWDWLIGQVRLLLFPYTKINK